MIAVWAPVVPLPGAGHVRHSALPTGAGILLLGEGLNWNEPLGGLVVIVGVAVSSPGVLCGNVVGPPLTESAMSGEERGSGGGDQVGRVGVQLPAAALLAYHDVLDAYADLALPDDGRLVCERHPGFQRCALFLGDERPLVNIEADAVAHPMAKVGPVAGVLDRRPAGPVDLRAGHRGTCCGPAGLLCRQHRCVGAQIPGGRLAAEYGATEVRAVAIEHGAEVEQDGLALAEGPRCTRAARLQGVLQPPGEDVGRERRCERAARPHLVLDLLHQLRHRYADADL